MTIAGRLAEAVVAGLLESCKAVEGALVRDLSGLVSADAEGLELLRELEKEGAELRGVSSFIRLLKNGDPVTCPPRSGPARA